ncbi:MAG TPA: glycosyltransferase [Cyclobacteriaceae bacterium]|nr:glycosyltransferase [Cyclobacteriaceae bacterium]
MTVGVIITVFNLEKYVAEAIESVLAQSFLPHRIIVVNDDSADNSKNVIELFKDRVELLNNEQNQGVLPSIISAMKKLDTDIFAFLDGDDRWHPDKLKFVMQAFERDEQAMLVTHSYRRMNAAGDIDPGKDKTLRNLERIENLKGTREQIDRDLKNSILSYKGVWLGSAFAIRKNCLDQTKFEQWSTNIWGHSLSHQDQPLAAFLILTNPEGRIIYLRDKLFDYRIFGENSSGSSATLEKALRTLSRSKATLLRTHDAVSKMKDRPRELKTQTNKLREIDYLNFLYTRKLNRAFPLFFSLFVSHWDVREKFKESVRLAGILLLGTNRLLKHK